MITIYNQQPTSATVDGFVVNPGLSMIPGPTATVYVAATGEITRESPAYGQSFAAGMLITLPFASVLVWRKILSLLKPTALDRFM